jgi:predicted PurR-regulated permease PerM
MNLPPPTPKQARVIWLALTGLAVATLAALGVGLIWGLGQVLQILSPVLWPLAIAGVVAYLLDPVVDWFERKGLSRARAILCVFGIAFLVLAGVLGSVVPQIIRETRQLVNRIPEIQKHAQEKIENWIEHPPALLQRILKHDPSAATPDAEPVTTNAVPVTGSTNNLTVDTNGATTTITITTTNNASSLASRLDKDTLQSAMKRMAEFLPKAGRWLFGQFGRVAQWFGVLAALALVPIYAFYLLLEKRGIESTWPQYLPVADSQFKDETVFILRSINGYLIAFFRGQVLVAICDSILYTIGFLIVGLPYAVLLGFSAIFLTLIPFLGAIALCATASVIALFYFGDWTHLAYVLGVFVVVQAIEGLVISPKIMGDRVGLHPLTIIIAVMAGTTLLGGLLGGILAIPLTAVLRVLLARYVWKKQQVS